MIKILNINHIWWKTGSFQMLSTLSNWMWKDYKFHNLFWYCFRDVPNSTSVYKTSNSRLYRNTRYKLAAWLNFLFEWLTPWHVDMKYLHNFKPYKEADIIHIHSVVWWFIDRSILPEISREKKLVMTCHDDWIVSWNDKDNIFFPYKTLKQYEKRRKIFQNTDITYVWVSDRITNKVIKDWIAWNNKVITIYNWINKNIFFKKDKSECREELKLPKAKKIIIGIAWAWKKTAVKWIKYVEKMSKEYSDKEDLLFVSLWSNRNKIVSDNLIETWFLTSEQMSKYFSAADLFLYPTLMDSFWLVVAESIACWCPVVAFDTWWVWEVVKWNWYVAKFKDYEDLKKWFNKVFNENLHVSLNDCFYQESMVNWYEQLYRSLLEK